MSPRAEAILIDFRDNWPSDLIALRQTCSQGYVGAVVREHAAPIERIRDDKLIDRKRADWILEDKLRREKVLKAYGESGIDGVSKEFGSTRRVAEICVYALINSPIPPGPWKGA